MFITSVNATGDKLFTGVVYTADKFIVGVNDTSKQPLSRIFIDRRYQRHRRSIKIRDKGYLLKFSLVTTTPMINLLPVTTTPVNKFIASDKNKDAMEMGSCQGES